MTEDLSNQYVKKTDIQHVLENPDTYCGSMEPTGYQTGVLEGERVVVKEVDLVPGLYKLFDEAIVNCRDHYTRSLLSENSVTRIDIDINQDTGMLRFKNNGPGIPIQKHSEYDVWIPELIFGHLRTSSNYDKSKKKRTGGKNGYGIKICFIWSVTGRIQLCCGGKMYKQAFGANLTSIGSPSITKCKCKDYTLVEFTPDYARMGVSGITDEMNKVFMRRVYDLAAVTDKSVSIYLNGSKVKVNCFNVYASLYLGPRGSSPRVGELANPNWEYVIGLSASHAFEQVSFVNGLHTAKGGKHVDYIVSQLIKKISSHIEKKRKVKVKASAIKEQLSVFIRCEIDNPGFDSQTKDYLTTPASKFGTSCTISDRTVKSVIAMGIADTACQIAEIKDTKALKKTDGTKKKTIRGVPELVDANEAGGRNSSRCMLMLVEGASAKAGVVSGLSREDRKNIGIYALRGKLMNVRGEKPSKMATNKEINDIKKIVGLVAGKEYTGVQGLRYGKIVLLADQDKDGSHIKGLCLNMFHSLWPSLLSIDGFISYMNTPILRATSKGTGDVETFYTEADYAQWVRDNPLAKVTLKYYKGLGTSTAKEFKEYMQDKNLVSYQFGGTGTSLDLVFNKKRSDDRKDWLATYDRTRVNDARQKTVSVGDFIDKEIIHFSKYDNERSIPSLIDGLKTSQRKVMFSAFKRNLTKEVKVSQFSGYVSEHSAYHHGEASLNACIINLAQDFVGSNNLNLLLPEGQFGTRLQGGKDSASDRYIFTRLSKVARLVFRVEDECVLEFLREEGLDIEPRAYYPILPLLLVNGAKGIGTGFSTSVPKHCPLEITRYLLDRLRGKRVSQLEPSFRGFNGVVKKVAEHRFATTGRYCIDKLNSRVTITELPIGTWTDDYKVFLEKLIDDAKTGQIIKGYTDLSTDKTVEITVQFAKSTLAGLDVEKLLKLSATFSTSNMHGFDEQERLVRMDTVLDIMEEFFRVRLLKYSERKDKLTEELAAKCRIAGDKAKFILAVVDGTVDLRGEREEEIVKKLEEMDLVRVKGSYEYLFTLHMRSLTKERSEQLMMTARKLDLQLAELKRKNPEELWIEELVELEAYLDTPSSKD